MNSWEVARVEGRMFLNDLREDSGPPNPGAFWMRSGIVMNDAAGGRRLPLKIP